MVTQGRPLPLPRMCVRIKNPMFNDKAVLCTHFLSPIFGMTLEPILVNLRQNAKQTLTIIEGLPRADRRANATPELSVAVPTPGNPVRPPNCVGAFKS